MMTEVRGTLQKVFRYGVNVQLDDGYPITLLSYGFHDNLHALESLEGHRVSLVFGRAASQENPDVVFCGVDARRDYPFDKRDKIWFGLVEEGENPEVRQSLYAARSGLRAFGAIIRENWNWIFTNPHI